MAQKILNYLKQCSDRDWLIGYDSQLFWQLTNESFRQILQLKEQRLILPKILIVETNPWKILTFFLASLAAETQIFLCNPYWRQQEWQQVFELVKPDLILGENYLKSAQNNNITNKHDFPDNKGKSLIMIPTGGTSGKIRFTIHTWSTLTASVTGFCSYFSTQTINSFCILPTYHVSGLMQFIRSFITSGKLAILSYSDLKQGEKLNINRQDFFISLVPTQLQFLLKSQSDWLSDFQTILLGGAPAWQSLLDTARKYKLPLAPTYGMTETASQIVTLKPKDFLIGNNSSGQVLPHARVTIFDEQGNLHDSQQVGTIAISAESLCLGYYDNSFQSNNKPLEKSEITPPYNNGACSDRWLITDDLGFFDSQGYLHIIGRCSQKIITGGENVFPAEVEAAILATQLVRDICVIGLPDSKWGQAVTAVYIPAQINISTIMIQKRLEDKLTKYKFPKYWMRVDRLPRNERGKINYQKIKEIVDDWHSKHQLEK